MNLLLNLCFVGERDRSKVDLPRFHRVVVFELNGLPQGVFSPLNVCVAVDY